MRVLVDTASTPILALKDVHGPLSSDSFVGNVRRYFHHGPHPMARNGMAHSSQSPQTWNYDQSG